MGDTQRFQNLVSLFLLVGTGYTLMNNSWTFDITAIGFLIHLPSGFFVLDGNLVSYIILLHLYKMHTIGVPLSKKLRGNLLTYIII